MWGLSPASGLFLCPMCFSPFSYLCPITLMMF
nr:MAG TPA: hypothetical protein [Caudoviricetes sp.]